jgi:uncharacterized protein YdeI (YjbR/CyaY-like superfamily)
MKQTDTPRTDAARFEALRSSAFRQDCIPLKLGQELERELAASQAEVERLQTLPESRHKAFLDLLERAEKSEAIIKQIHHYAGIIEGFQNPITK